jgi:Mg/Co/Ni transporter MgtE
MNQNLAALEETISKQAREAAIRDVGKVFSNLSMDLYHLGFNDVEEFQSLQSKVVEEVTRAKACLLAEQILRKSAALTKEELPDDDVIIIEEDIPDDCD